MRGGGVVRVVKCYSCGSVLLGELDCVAERADEDERHSGRCWQGRGVDEERHERIVQSVADLLRAKKRHEQLQLDDGIPF
jgi:hypothetical protein